MFIFNKECTVWACHSSSWPSMAKLHFLFQSKPSTSPSSSQATLTTAILVLPLAEVKIQLAFEPLLPTFHVEPDTPTAY